MKKITLLTAALFVGLSAFAETNVTYSFDNDVAGTAATTPVALKMAMATGCDATAGVASYTDANGITSNCLTAYSNGTSNATGSVDLSAFPSNATDYSVTWKECLGKDATEYKAGILLRATTGAGTYANGMKQGYYCLIHNRRWGGTETAFRIISATSSLSNLANVVADNTLNPSATQAMWYRASITGGDQPTITLEYSADSTTWNVGATYTDAAGTFKSGATQFVWGIGAPSTDFYIDNITFYSTANYSMGVQSVLAGASILKTEYYTLVGEKVFDAIANLRGFYIVKEYLSDGTVRSSKVYLK